MAPNINLRMTNGTTTPSSRNSSPLRTAPDHPTSDHESWENRIMGWLQRYHQLQHDPNSFTWTSWKQWWDKFQASSKRRILISVACSFLALVGYRQRARRRRQLSYTSATQAPLSLLYQAAREGQIQKALLGSSGVFYLLKEGLWKRSILPPNMSSQEILNTLAKVPDVSAMPESLLSRLTTPTLAALPFVYLFFMYRMLKDTMGGSDVAKFFIRGSQSTTTFADVAGLDDIIDDVSEIVTYLNDPTQYQAVGARPPRAILLYGPPGNGKTLLARAVAGQANVDCFLACSASEFVEVYVGRGASRVRSLFAQARQEAKQKGFWPSWMTAATRTAPSTKASAILFIDELDALAKTRTNFSTNDEREQTLNQLLTEMDGFADDDEVTLIVMAASNRVDVLDPAVLRRFDRQIEVGYPNEQGRKDILRIHSRNIACGVINWDRLASDLTVGFSGADLRNVLNDAALLAVRDRSKVVQQSHLEHAARRVGQMKWKGNPPNEKQRLVVRLGVGPMQG